MTRFSKLIFITLLLSSAQVYADNEFALGLILGNPTGLSGRVGIEESRSIDLAIASTSGSRNWHIHGTYLFENIKTFRTELAPLNAFYGVGARMTSFENDRQQDKTSLGVRLAVGVKMDLPTPQSEIFGEIAPVIDLTPDVDVDFDVGIGFRFRF
jgi:hypothetical protein